jgi:hypothetical protein
VRWPIIATAVSAASGNVGPGREPKIGRCPAALRATVPSVEVTFTKAAGRRYLMTVVRERRTAARPEAEARLSGECLWPDRRQPEQHLVGG